MSSKVTSARVSTTISESAYGARDARYEDVALTSFRDGAVLAFRMIDRDRADRLLDDGVRYAEIDRPVAAGT